MLGLGLGLEAKIVGLGLESPGLGLEDPRQLTVSKSAVKL